MDYRNGLPGVLLALLAAVCAGADPAAPAHWLDRADAELARAKLPGPGEGASASAADVAARLYELDPSPARLQRVRAAAEQVEAYIRDNAGEPAQQFGGHLALVSLYGGTLKDPQRYRHHLERAEALLEGGKLKGSIFSLSPGVIVAAVGAGRGAAAAKMEAERLPAGAARSDALSFAALVARSRGDNAGALSLLTWAAAELDAIDGESERDQACGRAAEHLANAGDLEQAMRVAGGIKGTIRSGFAYRRIMECARRRKQEEVYVAAYDAAKMLWHFQGAEEVSSLADLLAELGDGERAREAASAAMEKGSHEYWWFYTRMARIYARLGDRLRFETMAGIADRVAGGLSRKVEQARAELALARCHAILGDDESMNRRIARAGEMKEAKEVGETDLFEERADLIHALRDKARWDEAQKQIDTLEPGFRGLEIAMMVKAQLRAGELALATRSAETLPKPHQFTAWRAIAVERARRRQFDGLGEWIDRMDGGLRRAIVNAAVAEVLLGQPERIGRTRLED